MATKKIGTSKRSAQSAAGTKTKTAKSVQKTVAKKVVKTAVKKVVKKSALAPKKSDAKKNDQTKTTAVKKVAVKKVLSAQHKHQTVASKSVSKVASKKVLDNKKNVRKIETKKNMKDQKSNTAKNQSNLKKDKKNAEKDLAKTKKISKIVTLSADHNNKNKTMQKNIKEVSAQKKLETQTKKQQTIPDKNSPIIVSTVEKVSSNTNNPSTSADNVLFEIVDPGFLTNDDVFDEADHAQWQQLREQADIQSRAMQLNRPETHPDFNGTECVECGIEIPLARLKMHKVRCVDCQNELEQERARNQRTTYTSKSSSNGWDD